MNERFPAGGERQPVYDFLRNHGFVMSNWSDKHWNRADGLRLHLYGTGSRARIFDRNDNLVTDETLDTAVFRVGFPR